MKLPSGLTAERPVSYVPRRVIVILVAALSLQLAWQAVRPGPEVTISELSAPPSLSLLRVISLGEPDTLSRLLMLRLQAHDYQPGISIPFRDLDYDRLVVWLDVILELNPESHYPLLSASRVYSEVPDEDKKRRILEFVHAKFLERPAERWQWMAHAVYVAKHRLRDLELALEYARAIRKNVPVGTAPDWAMQMELFVLEDMGETESAMVLLGGLLESGVIRDENQLEFLRQRLEASDN